MVGKFECLNFLQHKRPFSCAEQEISHHFGNPRLPGVRSFRNSETARKGSLTREVARGHPARKVAPRLLSVQRGRQYLPFDFGNESDLKRGIDFELRINATKSICCEIALFLAPVFPQCEKSRNAEQPRRQTQRIEIPNKDFK